MTVGCPTGPNFVSRLNRIFRVESRSSSWKFDSEENWDVADVDESKSAVDDENAELVAVEVECENVTVSSEVRVAEEALLLIGVCDLGGRGS